MLPWSTTLWQALRPLKLQRLLPLQDLHTAMEAHLRLHFNNAESSDENVLNIYPTPLRKRILRFLYLRKLEQCYLFNGCKPKLLDALLGSATVHLFMPKVLQHSDGWQPHCVGCVSSVSFVCGTACLSSIVRCLVCWQAAALLPDCITCNATAAASQSQEAALGPAALPAHCLS